MLTTDLGACEWFVWDLRRSNLIDRGQLDQVIGEFLAQTPGAEPPLLAEHLVQKGFLTEFQAERLLQGKTQGFVLGPFTLMDALGAGSMGTVYKAQSKTDNKWYAVKVLPRRSMWNVRIARRKVRMFEQAQHPSVVPFVDVGTAGGMHYLAWPLVEGKPLDRIVQEEGKLSVAKTAQYAMQTAEGLLAAHQMQLFHGLLKPSNLMLSKDGVIQILDFGIGCLLSETEGESLVDTMSTANSVNSGLDCASPESIMDPTNLNAIGDQYSLGCVMYYCLTGRYPFPEGTAVEKMMCHQHKQPTPIRELNPDVPDEMIAIIERLMSKNPADRYPNFSEVIELLRPLAQPASSLSGQGTYRRPTMHMPRVPLSAQGTGPAPAAPSEPARAGQPHMRPTAPLPPRAPSAQPLPGRAAPQPAAPQRVQRPTEAPVPEVQRPLVAAPRPQQAAAPAEAAAPAPQPSQSSGQYSLITVVLLAVLAGVAAFFLSRLIPM